MENSTSKLFSPIAKVHNALKHAMFAGNDNFVLYKVPELDLYMNNVDNNDMTRLLEDLNNADRPKSLQNCSDNVTWISKNLVVQNMLTKVVATINESGPEAKAYVDKVVSSDSIDALERYIENNIEVVDVTKLSFIAPDDKGEELYKEFLGIIQDQSYVLMHLGDTNYAIAKHTPRGIFDIVYNVRIEFNPVAEVYAIMLQHPSDFKEANDKFVMGFTTEEPASLLTTLNFNIIKFKTIFEPMHCRCKFDKITKTTLESFYLISTNLINHSMINYGTNKFA